MDRRERTGDWRREHSLKGLGHHSWLGGSPGKSQELPKRQETFSCLFVLRCARRGDSERRLNELQRRARAAASSADRRDGRETLRLLQPPPKSLCVSTGHSTPPLPGAGAACHCQGPVIRGQLPQENARRASGCCNVTTPLPSKSRPAYSVPLTPPGLSEPEPPKQLLL